MRSNELRSRGALHSGRYRIILKFTDILYWHSWIKPRASPKKTRVRDEIVVVRFERGGRFLPEPAARYEVENHDENSELDHRVHSTQDEKWTEDVEKDTVRAILSLVASRPRKMWTRFRCLT